ncbi:hypothetical protein [Pseudomonas fluorescens]|nr:hypothetical protein [Pseudomonas fluorescens]
MGTVSVDKHGNILRWFIVKLFLRSAGVRSWCNPVRCLPDPARRQWACELVTLRRQTLKRFAGNLPRR